MLVRDAQCTHATTVLSLRLLSSSPQTLANSFRKVWWAMSAPESIARSRREAPAGNPTRPLLEAEDLARRALGIAMNSMWGGAEIEPLPMVPETLADEAQALLRDRVPKGRERSRALELLASSASSSAVPH